MNKGLLIVNTGNGKGKTTAALGQTLRALGYGYRVCFIQFIKGSWKYGELNSVKRYDDLLDFHVTGNGFIFNSENSEKGKYAAVEGWNFAKSVIASGKYFLVVLDELTYLINYGFIDVDDVHDTLACRPEHLHVIVTGRDAPLKLIEAADLVSEIHEVKHPYKSGVMGQKGIEF